MQNNSTCRQRLARDGFTLVELLVVVLLMSFLAGAAAMMVREPIAAAQLQHSISQLRTLDATARQRSGTASSLRLEFNLRAQRCRLLDERNNDVVPAVSIVSPHRITKVLPRRGHKIAIEYDRFGTTDTYSVCISSKSGKQTQLLILGLTGQSYVLEDEEQAYAITHR